MLKKYDVVVAGAGIAGLLASNVLADAGCSVLLLEADKKFAGGNAVYGSGEILNVTDAVYARVALQQYQYVCGMNAQDNLQNWVTYKFDALEESIPSLHRVLKGWGLGGESFSNRKEKHQNEGADGGLGITHAKTIDADALEERYRKKLRSWANYKIFQRVHLPKNHLRELHTSSLRSVLGVSSQLLRYFFDYPARLNYKEDRRICDGAAWVACLLDRVANHAQVTYAQFAKLHDIQLRNRQLLGIGFQRAEEIIEVECDKLILATGDHLQDADYASTVFGKAMSVQQHSWNTQLPNWADGIELAELAGGDCVRMHDLYEKLVCVGQEVGSNRIQVLDIEKELMEPDCLLLERNGFVVDGRVDAERKAAYKRAWDVLEADAEAQLRARVDEKEKSVGAVQLDLLEPEEEPKPNEEEASIEAPLFVIFDSRFRAKKTFGRLLPSSLMPDETLPDRYWDEVIYKADSIGALAKKMGVDVQHIERALASHNRMARMEKAGLVTQMADAQDNKDRVTDQDQEKGVAVQGGGIGGIYTSLEKNSLEQSETARQPLPLGEQYALHGQSHEDIGVAPFYAVPVWPGHAGCRGGVKTNADGQVLTSKGYKINGLYAVGGCAASVLDTYTPATLEGVALPHIDEDALELTEVMVTAYRAAMHAADLPLA